MVVVGGWCVVDRGRYASCGALVSSFSSGINCSALPLLHRLRPFCFLRLSCFRKLSSAIHRLGGGGGEGERAGEGGGGNFPLLAPVHHLVLSVRFPMLVMFFGEPLSSCARDRPTWKSRFMEFYSSNSKIALPSSSWYLRKGSASRMFGLSFLHPELRERPEDSTCVRARGALEAPADSAS